MLYIFYMYICTIYNTNIYKEKYTKFLTRRGKFLFQITVLFFFEMFLHNTIDKYIYLYIDPS